MIQLEQEQGATSLFPVGMNSACRSTLDSIGDVSLDGGACLPGCTLVLSQEVANELLFNRRKTRTSSDSLIAGNREPTANWTTWT